VIKLLGLSKSLSPSRFENNSVNAVAITGDNKYVVSGSLDKTIRVWNLETGEQVHSLKGHIHPVNAVAITGDNKYVVSGSQDSTLGVWNLETGEQKHSLKGHTSWVHAVAITGDNKYVVSGSRDKTIRVWNLETGEQVHSYTGDFSMYRCGISPDSTTIIAGDSGGKVHFLRRENW
jgi:WD40 repeat protein